MFRRKDDGRSYKSENMGCFIIEKTRMPHSLIEQDGNKYEVISWIISFRVENGPVFFTRTYTTGDYDSYEKMSGFLSLGELVDNDYVAQYLFNTELYKFFGGVK